MGYPKWWNGTSQMAKWDIPNGQMGYPKWSNGIPQKAKWDTPKGKMGHPKWCFGVWENGVSGIGTRVQRWSFGCRGLRNGGYESTLRAQNRIKGEREQSIFAIIRACKTASYSGIKHGIYTLKTSDLALYRTLIPNILLLHPTPLEQQLPHYERRTMQWTKNLHLQFAIAKNELNNTLWLYLGKS